MMAGMEMASLDGLTLAARQIGSKADSESIELARRLGLKMTPTMMARFHAE